MDDSLLTPEALFERWPLAGEFALPTNSRVAVIGAYRGLVMDLLDHLYHPAYLVGYEPQVWAVEDAQERLSGRFNMEMRPYALGKTNGYRRLWDFGTDAASWFRDGKRDSADLPVKDIRRDAPMQGHLDLVVMNCEGAEFELLPVMLTEGMLGHIDRLAVQFHEGLGNDEDYDGIVEAIGRSHHLVSDQRPAWIYWTRRGA